MQDYTIHILVQTASYAIAVFGLTVVLGLCGQINLAQAAFFGFGAYAVGIGTTDLHLNFWVALSIGLGDRDRHGRLPRHDDAQARRPLPGDGDDQLPADRHARSWSTGSR